MQKIAEALIKFRTDCPSVKFDSLNPHFKSRYASMAAIHAAIDARLSECGLVVLQFPIDADGKAGARTIILHDSGEVIEHDFLVPIQRQDPQSACAAVSYARRYGLSGALGLVTEEDDDGEAAMGRASAVAAPLAQKPARAPKSSAMSAANRDKIKHAADIRVQELGDESINQTEVIRSVASSLGFASPIQMQDADFARALSAVQTFEPGAVTGGNS